MANIKMVSQGTHGNLGAQHLGHRCSMPEVGFTEDGGTLHLFIAGAQRIEPYWAQYSPMVRSKCQKFFEFGSTISKVDKLMDKWVYHGLSMFIYPQKCEPRIDRVKT